MSRKKKQYRKEEPIRDAPDSFLAQVQNEIKLSRDFVEEKREHHRTNIVKYIDQTVDDEKIPMNTSYAMINLDLAIEMMDDQAPVFLPRGIYDDEIADNLNDVARFDIEEMGLDQARLVLGHDRRMYGVSIITKKGWNADSSTPEICVKDPLSWLPDPYFDYATPARFHYFEEYIPREMLSEEYGFSPDAEYLTSQKLDATVNNQTARNERSGYNQTPDDPGMVSVINGYTYEDDILYMVTLSSDAGQILRKVEIKPVLKDEEEKRVPMSAVVNIKWYSPKRDDPFGISMLEMTGPKQSALSQLYNLRLIDARFSTLGQIFLYDINTVANATELARATTQPKFIGVDGKNNPISTAVYPVPRSNIMGDSYRVTQEIMDSLQMETGINSNQLGVQSSGSQTLGEVKQIQENANIRFGLTAITAERSDKEFWRDIWFRSYKEFFSKTDRKFARITSSIDGAKTLELTKDDFLSIEDANVRIESKRKYESERKQLAMQLEAKLSIMEANPNTPRISLDSMRRKILKLQGFSRGDIQVIAPYTPDEMDARNIAKLLSENDMSAAQIRNMEEDHMTYLVVFQSAIDTPAKMTAIEMRKRAYIESGQSKKQEV